MKTDVNVSRREFLKTGAAGGAALVIGFYLPWDAAAQQPPSPPPPSPNPFNAWVRVTPEGTVALVVAKSEMGQGVRTSLPMILADELEVDWASVRIEQARTDPTIYRSLGTGGSSSVRESYLPLRQAGAAAREMLITAAAQAWSVPRQECFAEHGAVVHRPTGRRAPYGELVEAAEKLPLPDLASVPLKLAGAKAGWGPSASLRAGKPLAKGRGRGIAAAYSFRTYVAQVAEVSVDAKGGVRVHRVVCAVDCGRVVNPDIVKAQMESGIVYGLSAALKGEITIRDGAVEQANFNDYDMLRIDEMPEVEVHIVASTEPPTGVGEPGVPPIAAAVANAIFAATGKRLRRLPIRPGDLA